MLFNMQIGVLVLAVLAPFANAAIVKLFRETGCAKGSEIREINVKDNTCANWVEEGWKSYMLMTRGGPSQIITPYKGHSCVYPGILAGCVPATEEFVGSCRNTVGTDGKSYAIGSALFGFCE